MTTAEPDQEQEGWHGWAVGTSAIYLAALPNDDNGRIGLYRQEERVTDLLGVFLDEPGALAFMAWVDGALAATGHANTQLLRKLQSEIIVVPTPMGEPPQVEEDEEDDGKYQG